MNKPFRNVGFLIPPDFSGGKESEPDPIITEYNKKAEKYKTLLEDSTKYVEDNDNDDSPVKIRLKENLNKFKSSLTNYLSCAKKIIIQKQIIKDLLQFFNIFSTEIRKKETEWKDIPLFYTKEILLFLNNNKLIVENIFKKNGILLFSDISFEIEEFVNLIDTFNANTENVFSDTDGNWQKIKNISDNLVERFSDIVNIGNGKILSGYTDSINDFEEKANSLKNSYEEYKKVKLMVKNKPDDNNYQNIIENPLSDSKIDVPDNVPNYTIAIPNSPRICASCRFFEWKDEKENVGTCKSFNFTSQANYVCDAWQAIGRSSIQDIIKDTDNFNKGNITKENETMYDESFNIAENDAQKNIRVAKKIFYPGDTVYSKSLRATATIESITDIDDQKVFSLKLLDKNGVAFGSGFTYESDLEHKSLKATKTIKSLEEDLENIIDITRDIYKNLKTIVEFHKDLENKPLSNKEVLTPLQSYLISILQKPILQNVTTGERRKYYRAIQDATYAVGAARQILFDALKEIMEKQKSANKIELRTIMLTAQNRAYTRVEESLKLITDSLTMPSATHGTPAPGYKFALKTTGEIEYDLRKYFTPYFDSEDVIIETLSDNAVSIKIEHLTTREDVAQKNKIIGAIVNKISEDMGVKINIEKTDIKDRGEGKLLKCIISITYM
jgi:hypothetical protein